MTFEDVQDKLKTLKALGFVKTHRPGPTGIGKTLEDLVGIKENNIPGSDIENKIELKSERIGSNSMITLFTKSPLPYGVNNSLLEEFGYVTPQSKSKKILHTTLNSSSFNTLRGQVGLKISFGTDKVFIESGTKSINAYWDKDLLKTRFELKYNTLLLVRASTKHRGADEEFHFCEAYLLSGFSFDNFVKLLKTDDILTDIRIGQYPNGNAHDHGTGFRVNKDKLHLCFEKRIDLLA